MVLDRANRSLILAMCFCAVLTMISMGWVRESARAYNGYLIYGVIKLSDEEPTYRPQLNPSIDAARR